MDQTKRSVIDRIKWDYEFPVNAIYVLWKSNFETKVMLSICIFSISLYSPLLSVQSLL